MFNAKYINAVNLILLDRYSDLDDSGLGLTPDEIDAAEEARLEALENSADNELDRAIDDEWEDCI